MATLTLAQYAQTEKQSLKKGIYYGLAREGVVLDILKWRGTNGALAETGVRSDGVVEPDWIDLGGSISSKTTDLKPISYSVFEMAVHLDIPEPLHQNTAEKLAKDQSIQAKAALKGAAYSVNDAFVNGDHAVNGKQFEGLNKLVAAMDSGQTIGATELDISTGGADAAARFNVIDRMLEAHDAAEGHKPTHAFINATTSLKIRSILMREKLLGDHHNWLSDTMQVNDPRKTLNSPATKPSFIFDGVPYFVIGKKADQSTQIIGNTYTEGGSTAAATRIFYIKADDENVEGLMAQAIDVTEIGLLEDTDVRRWRLKGLLGLGVWGPRSIVKLQGLKVA